MLRRPCLVYAAAWDMGCRKSEEDGPCFDWRNKEPGRKGYGDSRGSEGKAILSVCLSARDAAPCRQQTQPCRTRQAWFSKLSMSKSLRDALPLSVPLSSFPVLNENLPS